MIYTPPSHKIKLSLISEKIEVISSALLSFHLPLVEAIAYGPLLLHNSSVIGFLTSEMCLLTHFQS